ncbi:DALR anticodon-binding domain-containing protein, partial [Staphylococcus epidermidis]|uniref:DALR anticodon-binding domain-containing protein n=1 Tax=Staphylococcus epidermidis TaxID=1282 RepID=UPI0021B2EE5D
MVKEGKEEGIEVCSDGEFCKINNDKGIELLKKVGELESRIESGGEHSATHSPTNYIEDVGGGLDKFYNGEKVVRDDREKSKGDVGMIEGVGIRLENGLGLVGVTGGEKW